MEDGDLVIHGDDFLLLSDQAELIQCSRHEINTNKGEWFLNPEMGIDFEVFRGKSPNEELMRSELQQALLQDSRIRSVDDITFELDRRARTMAISFIATGINGESVKGEADVDVG